jgi:hypothetical protein
MDRVSNQALVDAGLLMMKSVGKPLEKLATKSRAMKYRLVSGETVRIRTCNDHILVVLAASADEGAALNIEGTDHLLIVMPQNPRQPGPVIAYFVPTPVAVRAVRKAHSDWLASNPATRGNNRTWNIWFDEAPKSGGFGKKWSQYRLTAQATTFTSRSNHDGDPSSIRSLGVVIAESRAAIAQAAGVSIDAVKISVALD